MLTGIDLTFDLLARTRNEAAAFVLAPALESESQDLRMKAARALLQREEPIGVRHVLLALPQLGDEGWDEVAKYPNAVAAALSALFNDSNHQEFALQVADRLQLAACVMDVIDLSVRAESFSLRRDATNTVLKLATKIGETERNRSERSQLRIDLVQRLSEALRSNPTQLSLTLVDAFLSVVRSDDGCLKQICDQEDKITETVGDRLVRSRAMGVIQLLAQWIDRPRLPKIVQQALASRADLPFIDALVRAFGAQPSSAATSHIRRLRPLAGLTALNHQWKELDASLRPAILRAIATNEHEDLRVVRTVFEMLDTDASDQVEQAASRVLSEIEGLNADLVMRAALAGMLGDDSELDPSVRTVMRLIELAQGTGPLSQSSRRILNALHAETLLDRIDHLTEATSARLGSVVRQLDPDYVSRVEALLRHSVSRLRLRGIRGAIAMGLIDSIPDVWLRMFQGLAADHQESRIAAIYALQSGTGTNSLQVLRKIVQMTTGAVQEAAAKALAERLHQIEEASKQKVAAC